MHKQQTQHRQQLHGRTLLALLAAAAIAAPAAADWVVTRDGARLETRGPWEVRGNMVVFTLPNGTLSSLAVADVDLDKSAEATAAARAPRPAAEREKEPRAVLTIDEDDVGRARRARSSAAAVAATEPVPDPAAAGAESGGDGRPRSFHDQLEVTGWDKAERDWLDGVEVVGRLANLNDSTASDISLTVRIFDENGEPLASGNAFLEERSLLGRRSLEFRIPFEGVHDFADVEFEISATEVLLGQSGVDELSDLTAEEGGGG